MKVWLTDIGCAAGIVPFHATYLTIDGHDSAGAGSAALDDEVDDGMQDIVGDDFPEDGDDLDDQPRGRRTARQEKAYDELKSDRDRLKADLDKRDRDFAAMQERLSAIEGKQESRREVNDRTNATIDRAKQRAKEVVGEIKKLDRSDPEYAEKVYEAMLTRVYEDQAESAQEISRRTSSEVYHDTRTQEELRENAKQQAIDALEEAGLSAEAFDLVEALAIRQGKVNPGWFRTTPEDEQIPKLVEMVKERLVKTKRNSQEFKDEKRRHRASMDGVIEEGNRNARARRTEDDADDEPKGSGSILADLARMKQNMARNTKVMLRQADTR